MFTKQFYTSHPTTKEFKKRKRGTNMERRKKSVRNLCATATEVKCDFGDRCEWCGAPGGSKRLLGNPSELPPEEIKDFVMKNILCSSCVELAKEVNRLGLLIETLKKQLNALVKQITHKKVERLKEVNEESEGEPFADKDGHATDEKNNSESESDEDFTMQTEDPSGNDSDFSDEETEIRKEIRSKKTPQRSQVSKKICEKSKVRNRGQYSCFYCDLTFPKKEEKFHHDESLHFAGSSAEVKGDSLLYSRICGRSSFTPSDLYSHDLTFHSRHLNFLCLCCTPHRKFTTKELLSAHNEVHKDDQSSSFKCELCESRNSVSFNLPTDLDNHILRVHSFSLIPKKAVSEKEIQPECLGGPSGRGKKSVRCRFCGVSKAGGLFGMKAHERKSHLAEFTWTCSKEDGGCGTRYAEETHAKTCQLTHKTHHNGEWNCFVCNLKLDGRLKLKDHLEAKHTVGGVKCEFCSGEDAERFKCAYNLKLHQARAHGGGWPHKCFDCGKGFKSRQHLEDHVRNIHAEKESVKLLECKLCKKQFAMTKRLLRHRKVEHEGMKGILCQECGKMLTTEYSMKLHMKSHKGEKDQICHFCGKKYADPASLKVHMRNHTGEKPYSCHICGKTWAHVSMRRKHWEVHKENGTWVEKTVSTNDT